MLKPQLHHSTFIRQQPFPTHLCIDQDDQDKQEWNIMLSSTIACGLQFVVMIYTMEVPDKSIRQPD